MTQRIDNASVRLQSKLANALIDFYLEHDFRLMPDNEWVQVSVKVKLNPRDLTSIQTTDLQVESLPRVKK